MSVTVTFLANDVAETPFLAEHGLSLLIAIDGCKILFDTGQGAALLHNAQELGVSLSGLDALVLSHGHYDHSGNLAEIVLQNPDVPVLAHPECVTPRWSLKTGQEPKPVGLADPDRVVLTDHPTQRLKWCRTPVEIVPGVWVTGEIPRTNSFEDVGGAFYLDRAGDVPDLIPDDMALWIEGEAGVTLVCGCCHSGIQNTMEHIATHSGGSLVTTIIGGLHLLNASPARLAKTFSFLNKTGVQRIFPAHCTGKNAITMMREQLVCDVLPCTAGMTIGL